MTYGPMASKIRCCATSQLYTYGKLKPLAGTQGPQVYRLQWCLRPWEYWQQRIYPRYRYAFHHQVAIHQITSWHQNLLGYFLGNKAFHFFMLKWYQKDVSNSLRHYSLLQGRFPPLAFWMLLARANVSVLIFVVAAYSGGFLKVPKSGVSTGESLPGGAWASAVHIGELVDCKDIR